MPRAELTAIAQKARTGANSFQALVALGYWPQNEPLDPQRIEEALEKVRADRNLLNELEADLEQLLQ